jgi:hypothetical protein
MNNGLAFLSLALLLGPRIAPALDLSPRYIDTLIDGIPQHSLYFSDGSKKIAISVDRETDVTSESGAALFRFPKFSSASFRLMLSPHKTSELFAAPDLERYRATVMQLIPTAAVQPIVEEESVDPIPVNRWRSYRFVLSWSAGAERVRRSVTFLNVSPEQQIILQTTATLKEFDEAALRSYEIIRTWHPMLADDVRPATIN